MPADKQYGFYKDRKNIVASINKIIASFPIGTECSISKLTLQSMEHYGVGELTINRILNQFALNGLIEIKGDFFYIKSKGKIEEPI